jgi:N-acetylglutamate synthase-like GNAT family acetyltransferase
MRIVMTQKEEYTGYMRYVYDIQFNGNIIGWFEYLISLANPHIAEIYHLEIQHSHRGEGLGKETVKRMLRSLSHRGVTNVYVHNHEISSLFWAKFGFECIAFGDTPPLIREYGDEWEDKLEECYWDNGTKIQFHSYDFTEEDWNKIEDHATYLRKII